MSQNPGHMPPGDAGHGLPPGNPPADGPVVVPLEVLQQALAPLIQSSERTEQEMAQVKTRLAKIEETQAKHAEGSDTEGNNRRSGGARPKGSWSKKRACEEDEDEPDNKSLHNMQNTFRSTLFSGCDMGKMNELQPGMSEDEWEEKKAEDPALPWRPDFMASVDSPRNKFWVNKMLDEYMKNTAALKLVEAPSGGIARKYWTRECITKFVIKPMWYSARSGVKQATQPDVKDRVERQAKHSNQQARKQRLMKSQARKAINTKDPFQYNVNNELRSIPEELLVDEIGSDVLGPSDTEYEWEAIRPDVIKEEYLEARAEFQFEGVPPFWRHDIWNKVFAALDKHTDPKGASGTVSARYYASKVNRGQRKTSFDLADTIPATILYRCHIAKEWYWRMPRELREAVKKSPEGWEVDEEIKSRPGSPTEGTGQ